MKSGWKAIDRIHLDIQNKLMFLTAFNQETQMLAISRFRETKQLDGIKNLYQKRDN